jgi:hypothetical protein
MPVGNNSPQITTQRHCCPAGGFSRLQSPEVYQPEQKACAFASTGDASCPVLHFQRNQLRVYDVTDFNTTWREGNASKAKFAAQVDVTDVLVGEDCLW